MRQFLSHPYQGHGLFGLHAHCVNAVRIVIIEPVNLRLSLAIGLGLRGGSLILCEFRFFNFNGDCQTTQQDIDGSLGLSHIIRVYRLQHFIDLDWWHSLKHGL